MKFDLEKFFEKDKNAFYTNKYGQSCFKGIDGDRHKLRRKKAAQQVAMSYVPYKKVISYTNELLNEIKIQNGFDEKSIGCDFINLGGAQQNVVDNAIIVKECVWKQWDNKEKRYDEKYYTIKDIFKLSKVIDIVWMKFTTEGHLGVIGKGCDINYNYDNSSGKLLLQEKKKWDETFVIIFPLTAEILGNRESGDIELAIGNYLISDYCKVPIIDYYSHQN